MTDLERRIQTFTDTGARGGRWGQHGGEPGQLANPSGVAVDAQGNVFVADTDNGRIQKLDSTGRLLDGFVLPPAVGEPGEAHPRDVPVAANGDAYTLDDEVGRFGSVYVYRQAGGSGAAASVASTRLRYRRGRIGVKVACNGATRCRGKLKVSKGGRRLASATYGVAAGAAKTVKAKAGSHDPSANDEPDGPEAAPASACVIRGRSDCLACQVQ